MKIDSTHLSELMLDLAADRFGEKSFGRRQLMDATEQEVRRRQLWTEDDEPLSGSVGVKSRGLAAIDFRFSDLARLQRLLKVRHNTWQLAPTEMGRVKTTATGKRYLTRISYNSKEWRTPTRDAQDQEEVGTYNQEHGFGLEDWLFRNEWLIDGWRYAFIEGVNKSRERLLEEQTPFDVTLFTIDDRKRRRYVATIRSAECLSDDQAEAALSIFRANGWLDTMQADVERAGGNAKALRTDPRAKHILNVRFRVENVAPFPPGSFAEPNDPIFTLNRYTLANLDLVAAKQPESQPRGRAGSEHVSTPHPYVRKATASVVVTPEHALMQAKLVEQLKDEFPNAQILCEENFVDVSVRTDSELLLFEIKSDQEAKSVIRQALGQILEYAYHPARKHTLPLRLFIVGRTPASTGDVEYLNFLKSKFALPISYRTIAL